MDVAGIKRNLNGKGSVTLEDGVLTGVDVGSVLRSIETMIRSKRVASLPQGGETEFDNFSSTVDIRNGIVTSNDLLIEAPGWKVNGAGTLVNLLDDTINYNLIATVEPATATSNDEEFDIGGYSLPIACKGNINSPSCLPDAQQIIAAAVTSEVQRRLGDFLQDRLGGAVRQQAPANQNPTGDAQTPEDDAEPAEEAPSVEKELINRALDRLFR
jgi:AsmA protein